jgi:hypothetical protein
VDATGAGENGIIFFVIESEYEGGRFFLRPPLLFSGDCRWRVLNNKKKCLTRSK